MSKKNNKERKLKGELARFLTGLVGAGLAVVALVFLETPMLGLLIIPFAAMACYEICHVAGIKNKPLFAVAVAVAAAVPPLLEYEVFRRLNVPIFLSLLGYFFLLMILMLAGFEKTKVTDVLVALLASLGAPGAMATLTMLRNLMRSTDPMWEMNLAVQLIFYIFCCSWLTDTFAFLVGKTMGKTKLCPKISPKKSVEGALGGLVLTSIANAGFALMFNQFFLARHRVNIPAIFALSFLLCAISMLGDLTASTFKRNFGAKDYGKFFPGHGGVMDRFDSTLFVAPALFGILQLQYHYGWDLLFK